MYTDTSYDIYLYMALPLAVIPLANPCSTYLAPSSCDRNRPPQSQVARKLSPLSPIAPLYPPPRIPNPPGFPGPNVLLIRAHHNSLSSMQHTSYSLNTATADFFLFQGGEVRAGRPLAVPKQPQDKLRGGCPNYPKKTSLAPPFGNGRTSEST
jgi:hypothetical protein